MEQGERSPAASLGLLDATMVGIGAMTNIGSCMTARRMAPELKAVARIAHGDHEEMVDAVVYPEELAAHAAANDIIDVSDGGVRTIEQITEDLELVESKSPTAPPPPGRRWRRSRSPGGRWSSPSNRAGGSRLRR